MPEIFPHLMEDISIQIKCIPTKIELLQQKKPSKLPDSKEKMTIKSNNSIDSRFLNGNQRQQKLIKL